jgi:hypothetical protein
MRTTLTLDDDVAALIETAQASSDKTFKEIVNEALRRGLSEPEPKKPPRQFQTRGRNLGICRLPSLDNVAEALALGEGDGFR